MSLTRRTFLVNTTYAGTGLLVAGAARPATLWADAVVAGAGALFDRHAHGGDTGHGVSGVPFEGGNQPGDHDVGAVGSEDERAN